MIILKHLFDEVFVWKNTLEWHIGTKYTCASIEIMIFIISI